MLRGCSLYSPLTTKRSMAALGYSDGPWSVVSSLFYPEMASRIAVVEAMSSSSPLMVLLVVAWFLFLFLSAYVYSFATNTQRHHPRQVHFPSVRARSCDCQRRACSRQWQRCAWRYWQWHGTRGKCCSSTKRPLHCRYNKRRPTVPAATPTGQSCWTQQALLMYVPRRIPPKRGGTGMKV